MRPSFSLSWWLPRLLLAFILAWVSVLGGFAAVYVQSLLHPTCPTGLPQPPGYQSVALASPRGFSLSGWYLAPTNGAVIILLGGHGANRDAMLPEAEMLASAGYGILALEQRACAGQLATLGYREAEDVLLAVDYALRQPGVMWVGALGFSAGGVAVIRAAAQDERIRAVVAEGNYASLLEEMSPAPGGAQAWLEWQLHPLAAAFYTLQTGIWPGLVNPQGDLARISPRPVLLIHGQLEVARTRGEKQFESATQPKTLWVAPGVGHGGYLQAAGYPLTLVGFFDLAR